ncbi:MAG TPA: hypothetical protein VNR87_05195 [Flavisolibacter sp.]|nr:hypothetical protein [Flavisolibacter sp.]
MQNDQISRSQLVAERFKQCEVCAYHESGHILFAYLCGYRCRHAALINEPNEDEYSSVALIDYGKDAEHAVKFMGSDVQYFRSLALAAKLESVEVGRRLARIFLGGSVAAAIYNNHSNAHIPLPMQIDYLDLQRVEFIEHVMKETSTDEDENFIEHGLRDALYTLANVNIWETVADLANRLLANNELDMGDIEECLEEHGINYDEASPMDTSLDFS